MPIVAKLALPLSSYPTTLAAVLVVQASSMVFVRAPIAKPTTPPKVVLPAAASLTATIVTQLQTSVWGA